jgi:nitrogen fixation protein FixH
MNTPANDNRQPRPLTGRMVLACFIGFFAVVGGANAIMVTAAVTTFSGLETASSYQAGLSFARDAEAARTQDALHWKVKADLRPSTGATVLDIDARDSTGKSIPGLQATAHLSHPTDRRADRDVALREKAAGQFIGSVEPLAGQWDLIIELSRDGERMFRSRNRIVLN